MIHPFLTFIVPSFRRPYLRERCVESVRKQSIVGRIQLFTPEDLVGVGIGGMYGRLPIYAPAVIGEYVHLLADDDWLEHSTVVQELETIAKAHNHPPVIIVEAIKRMEEGDLCLPLDKSGPPICGRIDLGCIVTRADVWKQHVKDYGPFYEGDHAFAKALWDAGHQFLYTDLLFLRGEVMRGRPEA